MREKQEKQDCFASFFGENFGEEHKQTGCERPSRKRKTAPERVPFRLVREAGLEGVVRHRLCRLSPLSSGV